MPKPVLFCKLAWLEPGYAQKEPIAMSDLVIVELIKNQQGVATELAWNRVDERTNSVGDRWRPEFKT